MPPPQQPADHVERALCVLAHPDDVDFGSAGHGRHLDRGGHRGHLLHRHRRRRGRIRRHPAGPDGPAAPGGAARRGGRGRGDRRAVPRLPGRPAGADPRPAPRHQPGDPAGAAAAGADQLARAVVGPDRREPPRPHDRRRVDAARGLPRRPQPVRLPRAARRRGPRGVDGVGGLAGREPAGRPRRRRHRRRRAEVGGAAVARQPGRPQARGADASSSSAGWMAATAQRFGLPEGRLAEAFHVVHTA